MRFSSSRSLIAGATLVGTLIAGHVGGKLGNARSYPAPETVRHKTAQKIVATMIHVSESTIDEKKETSAPFEAITKTSNRDILKKLGYSDKQIESFSEYLIARIAQQYRLSQAQTTKDIRDIMPIFNPKTVEIDQKLRQLSIEIINYDDTSDAINTLLEAITSKHAQYSQNSVVDVDTLRKMAEADIELKYLYEITSDFSLEREKSSIRRMIKKLQKGSRTGVSDEAPDELILIDGVTYADLGQYVCKLAEDCLAIDEKSQDEKQNKIYQAWLLLNREPDQLANP